MLFTQRIYPRKFAIVTTNSVSLDFRIILFRQTGRPHLSFLTFCCQEMNLMASINQSQSQIHGRKLNSAKFADDTIDAKNLHWLHVSYKSIIHGRCYRQRSFVKAR